MKDLLVIYRDTTLTDSKLQKGFNGAPSQTVGREWIVQKIAKQLLTETGSSAYTPTYGIYLGNVVGSSFGKNDLEIYKTFLVKAVNKVETNIIDQQTLYPDIRDSERVESIEVQNIQYDQKEAKIELFLKVKMVNNNVLSMRV